MGGKGSGRRAKKRLTTEFERVTVKSLTDFNKAHCQYARWQQWRVGLLLQSHEFIFKNGVSRTTIEGYVICPECHDRKKVLFAERDRSRLACQQCMGLLYPSQRVETLEQVPQGGLSYSARASLTHR